MKNKYIIIIFIVSFILMLSTFSFFDYLDPNCVKKISEIVKCNIIRAIITGVILTFLQIIGFKLTKKVN